MTGDNCSAGCGWADFQVRPAQAIVHHWHLVMLAYTFSLLAGAPQPLPSAPSHHDGVGGKITGASGLAGYLAPGADLAVPLSSARDLLAAVVYRTTPSRGGRHSRARRTLTPTGRPNRTNQRLG
jgi:hypothetical protein